MTAQYRQTVLLKRKLRKGQAMTKLYLFDEDGSLAFCEEVSIADHCLNKIEELGNSPCTRIERSVLDIFSEPSNSAEAFGDALNLEF